jgi:hypothetical protein
VCVCVSSQLACVNVCIIEKRFDSCTKICIVVSFIRVFQANTIGESIPVPLCRKQCKPCRTVQPWKGKSVWYHTPGMPLKSVQWICRTAVCDKRFLSGQIIYKLAHLFSVKCSFFFYVLGSTAQLRPWPPPQNPAEFFGGFSTIFFFTG